MIVYTVLIYASLPCSLAVVRAPAQPFFCNNFLLSEIKAKKTVSKADLSAFAIAARRWAPGRGSPLGCREEITASDTITKADCKNKPTLTKIKKTGDSLDYALGRIARLHLNFIYFSAF